MMNKKWPDISAGVISLIRAANSSIELDRRAFPAYVLMCEGANAPLIKDKEIKESQKTDGGWISLRDTALFAAHCRGRRNLIDCYNTALSWLSRIRCEGGGWGNTDRDKPRITATGLLLYLLPELSDAAATRWLKDEWEKDLKSDTRLTYKGGFFLMGLSASGVKIDDCRLIEETYSYLYNEQNEDGGFGPWKDHPIGSDPWSTGIVLLGLLSYPKLVERDVIERTVSWLAATQLPNGLWPYHYIEEGSAYAYWGLVEAVKYLSREST